MKSISVHNFAVIRLFFYDITILKLLVVFPSKPLSKLNEKLPKNLSLCQ